MHIMHKVWCWDKSTDFGAELWSWVLLVPIAHWDIRTVTGSERLNSLFFKNGCWDPLTRCMPERRGLQCRRSQTPKGVSNTTAHPSQQTNQAFICLSVGFSVCKMWVRSSPLDRRIADITFINLLMPLNHLPRDLRSPGSYTCAPSPTPAHLRAVRLVPAVWSLSAGRTSGC